MASSKSGYLIAAAFIGPGTVTTATLAGANFGLSLVWALLFSVLATIVLQDMAVRLGVASGQSLSHGLKQLIRGRIAQACLAVLIIGAIGVGNAAYESGNLTGAAIGLNTILAIGVAPWAGLLGVLAALVLWSGHAKFIESILVILVAIMAAVFVATLVVAQPDWQLMLAQITSPVFDVDAFTTILALIGTTIVPYNLFLHASLVANEARGQYTHEVMGKARHQSVKAISIGGLITLVIMATAMNAYFVSGVEVDASNMSSQLEPVLGEHATTFFALGIFAAGLTSAITAPLAAAYAVCGALNLPTDMRSASFKLVWFMVILVGVLVASMGFKPITAILFAQATNGLLLPIVAVLLIVLMNRHPHLGKYRNRLFSNLIGSAIVIFILGLAGYKLYSLF